LADIVGLFGVPHTPIFPFMVQSEGPASETGQLFSKVALALRAAKPDVIVIFDTDHLNTFFLDNLPVFSIGVTERFKGPNDEPRGVPIYTIKSAPTLAAHIRSHAIRSGFDVALAQEFSVDHSIAVPLHFLTPDMKTPVIPVFINGHVPPLPSAHRCFNLGSEIKAAIESWPEPLRVAIIGTGSFSLEVWGPRIAAGRTDGVPDPNWVTRVSDLIETGQIDELISEATEERMLRAGNVGGELLNWLALLAFVGKRRPDFLAKQMQNGHAYAVWS
jgi:gallate dioxygenase